eukprot:4833462-Amphidinium_carterae.1
MEPSVLVRCPGSLLAQCGLLNSPVKACWHVYHANKPVQTSLATRCWSLEARQWLTHGPAARTCSMREVCNMVGYT